MNRQDWGSVWRLLADLGRVLGVSLLLPGVVAIATGETRLAIVFGVTALAVFGLSSIERHRAGDRQASNWQATLALTLAWPLFSLISAVPFVLGGLPALDAAFEGVSAWTDTGLTMIKDPAGLPASLATFRILIQWFSGLGIVMFTLLLRASSPRAAWRLFQAEGRSEDFSNDIWQIGRVVVRVYAAYTLVGALGLWLTGLPPVAALAHAVTSLSTGGFSTNSVGVGVYGALPSVVAMILMLAGGISFTSHLALLRGKIRAFWETPENRWLLGAALGAFVLVMIGFWSAGEAPSTSALPGAFYVITALTTCGAGTTLPLSSLPSSVRLVVLLLMVSGAAAGSTTGAVKLWRWIVVSKIVGREVRRPFYPRNAVMPLRIGDRSITDSQAAAVAGYVMLYVLIGLGGSLIFALCGYEPLDAAFTVFSAQGNVGLNAMTDELYFGMSSGLKVLLVVHMLAGRVEILPLLSLVRGLREA